MSVLAFHRILDRGPFALSIFEAVFLHLRFPLAGQGELHEDKALSGHTVYDNLACGPKRLAEPPRLL